MKMNKWSRGRFEFVRNTLKATFGKQNFDYDVSDLGAYVDEQSMDVMENLVNEGNLKSSINVMTGVKGKEEIKLISSTPSLQAAASCGCGKVDCYTCKGRRHTLSRGLTLTLSSQRFTAAAGLEVRTLDEAAAEVTRHSTS